MSEIKYVLLLDLDNDGWEGKCPDLSYSEGVKIIKNFLLSRGFKEQQSGVYLNCGVSNPVETILSTLDLVEKFSWVREVLWSAHLLRVTDYDDLFSIIQYK